MDETHETHSGADAAIKAAGSGAALARALGIRKEAVWQWRERGVPVERVHEVARVTGIAPHVLRPDKPELFPVPDLGEAA